MSDCLSATFPTSSHLPLPHYLTQFNKPVSELIWSHATNSVELLEECYENVDFIEVDIIEYNNIAYISHDRLAFERFLYNNSISDMDLFKYSFEYYVIKLFNFISSKKSKPVGLKLDFKSPLIVKYCISILSNLPLYVLSQIWLNADILNGPNGNISIFNPTNFLHDCTLLNYNYTLSLGWTTGYEISEYTEDMINEMIELLKFLKCNVTFPVRFNCATLSVKTMNYLISKSDLYSLTFWSCKIDKFNVEDLRYFNDTKCFIDVYK